MEQTDYLLHQLNNLTNFLKHLLSNILKLKDLNPPECLHIIQESLKKNLNKDVNEVAQLSNEKFMALLSEQKISIQGKEYLAEILQISANLSNDSESHKLLLKSLLLYEHVANENMPNFSLGLHAKIEATRKQLIK